MGEYGIKHGVKRLLLGHKIFYKITVGFRETHPSPRHLYVCYAKKNGGTNRSAQYIPLHVPEIIFHVHA